MNITKEIITDLFPLYAVNECSADSRALVEEYLRQHPQDAEEFRRALATTLPAIDRSSPQLEEADALRRAQRLTRRRSWLMGLAIFCSLAPFSFFYSKDYTFWLLRDAPMSALVYGLLAAGFWIAYAVANSPTRNR